MCSQKQQCRFTRLSLILFSLTLLTACSGSGKSSSTEPPVPPPVVTGSSIKLFVAKGPAQGVQCSLLDAVTDAQIAGPTTTNNRTASFTGLTASGLVYVLCSGGQYIDEATGETVDATGLTLRVVATLPGSGTLQLSVTPLTDMLVQQAINEGGLVTNLDTAAALVANQFGLSADSLVQVRPTNALTSSLTYDAAGIYGIWIAAMSQKLADLNNDIELGPPASGAQMQAFLTDVLMPALTNGEAATVLNNPALAGLRVNPNVQNVSSVVSLLRSS